jgi:RNA polymerase-binding transcription factor DksA
MARLDALPYATMCIDCQRDAEREGGSQGSRASAEEPVDIELDVS